MKQIVVTGAAGFIGSNLCERLLTEFGCEVIGIDNFDPFYPRELKEQNLSRLTRYPKFHFIEGDIRAIKKLGIVAKDVELVIHMAAKAGVRPSIENAAEYASVNIIGTISVLEWMKDSGIKKLIFASSSSVYGNNKKVPFSESDNVDFPVSPYAASKKSAELFTHTYHHLYKIDVLNLRFFTVYGPGQRPDLAIHKFTKNIYGKLPIEMYGDGSTSRDYTYVDDIVDGVVKAKKYILENNGVYKTINIGNHTPVALRELLDKLRKVSGKDFKVNQLPSQPGDVEITYADIQKARQLLNYSPAVDFEEGLRTFIEYYEKTFLHH